MAASAGLSTSTSIMLSRQSVIGSLASSSSFILPCKSAGVVKLFSSQSRGIHGSGSRMSGRIPRLCRDKSIRAVLLEEVASVTERNPDGEKSKIEEHGSELSFSKNGTRPLKVLVAGGGIGGLVFALAAKNRGMDVTVRMLITKQVSKSKFIILFRDAREVPPPLFLHMRLAPFWGSARTFHWKLVTVGQSAQSFKGHHWEHKSMYLALL